MENYYSISMYPSEFVRCAFSLIVFSTTSWFEPIRQFFRLLPFRTIALSHKTQFSMTTLKRETKLLNGKHGGRKNSSAILYGIGPNEQLQITTANVPVFNDNAVH